jgi:hypothetical protein
MVLDGLIPKVVGRITYSVLNVEIREIDLLFGDQFRQDLYYHIRADDGDDAVLDREPAIRIGVVVQKRLQVSAAFLQVCLQFIDNSLGLIGQEGEYQLHVGVRTVVPLGAAMRTKRLTGWVDMIHLAIAKIKEGGENRIDG